MSDTTTARPSPLAPERIVTLQGRDIKIRPFKFSAVARVAPLLSGVAQALAASAHDGDGATLVHELLAVAAEPVEQLCRIALEAAGAGELFDDLDIDEGLALAGAVIGVNSEQYRGKLPAALSGLTSALNGPAKL